jgi:hypothetical protein
VTVLEFPERFHRPGEDEIDERFAEWRAREIVRENDRRVQAQLAAAQRRRDEDRSADERRERRARRRALLLLVRDRAAAALFVFSAAALSLFKAGTPLPIAGAGALSFTVALASVALIAEDLVRRRAK